MTTKGSRKKLLYTMGGVLAPIIGLALLATYISSYVGVGFLSQAIWKVDAKESDTDIDIDIDSKGIPAYNKIMLIKIWNVMFWVSFVFGAYRLLKQMKKRK